MMIAISVAIGKAMTKACSEGVRSEEESAEQKAHKRKREITYGGQVHQRTRDFRFSFPSAMVVIIGTMESVSIKKKMPGLDHC
mmetsp:Transcript_17301/g.24497  ORF Transcript_17301/g.24497 Transcript_17301/m.24497 type:complete len:83 (-) Transcript_17301:791-1039(-)